MVERVKRETLDAYQFGNEQRSTPIPQCAVESKSCDAYKKPSPRAGDIRMGSFRLQQPVPGIAYEGIKRSFPQRLQI